MCAVMRVAVALDRCDTSAIQEVHVFQQSESIILVSSTLAVSYLSLYAECTKGGPPLISVS